MTVRQFFYLFKNNLFVYEAKGTEGGKNGIHQVTFGMFGSVGPNAYIEKTFTFIIQNQEKETSNSEVKYFKRLANISEEILDMELITIVEIILKGENRTKDNYFNDHSNIKLVVCPISKAQND